MSMSMRETLADMRQEEIKRLQQMLQDNEPGSDDYKNALDALRSLIDIDLKVSRDEIDRFKVYDSEEHFDKQMELEERKYEREREDRKADRVARVAGDVMKATSPIIGVVGAFKLIELTTAIETGANVILSKPITQLATKMIKL